MLYLTLKTLHIISSTFVFGAGTATAYYILFSYKKYSKHPQGATLFSESLQFAIKADFIFTVFFGIVQLVTGLWMANILNISVLEGWPGYGLLLYFAVFFLWLPAAYLQIKMKKLAQSAVLSSLPFPPKVHVYFRIWLVLGFPAFSLMAVIFYLMVFKPTL